MYHELLKRGKFLSVLVVFGVAGLKDSLTSDFTMVEESVLASTFRNSKSTWIEDRMETS